MRLVTTAGERLERRRFLVRRILEEHGRLSIDKVGLARVGLALSQPQPVLVVRPLDDDRELLHLVGKIASVEIESDPSTIALPFEGTVVCVAGPGFDAEGLLQTVRHVVGDEVAAGLGTARPGVEGLFRSYREARWAAKAGPRVLGCQRVVSFSELGSYRWLEPLDYAAPDDATEAIVCLREHDRTHGTHLIETLTAFLGSPLSKDAAGALYIHRNTLRYRLSSIHKITGLDPNDSDDRLVLELQQRLDSVRDPDASRPARTT